MAREKFLGEISEILDTEIEINFETILLDLEEWDSLSKVSFMSLANAKYGKKISPQSIRDVKTVEDLYLLLQK